MSVRDSVSRKLQLNWLASSNSTIGVNNDGGVRSEYFFMDIYSMNGTKLTMTFDDNGTVRYLVNDNLVREIVN